MNEIRPFRGWHYTGEVSRLIAPPYDILSGADKQALLARSADNIVAVDLPHVPPKEVGPDAAYAAAAEKLAALQAAGTLVQDPQPALYAYSQTYTWAERTFTRRAILAAVRATELYEGVWPHEKTFAGPKADRLKLTEATGVQLSPIFGVFDDGAGLSEDFWAAVTGPPALQGTLNGVEERMWTVTAPATLERVSSALRETPIFIADGHHRYTTAMNYAKALRQAGRIGPDDEANFVLFALVPMDDPGLLVLPTHRLITGLPQGMTAKDVVERTTGPMAWQAVKLVPDALADADALLNPYGQGGLALLDSGLETLYVGRLADPAAMAALAPDQSDTWRRLNVAILHRLILDETLAPLTGGKLEVTYTAHGAEVVAALRDGSAQLAAVLQGTPITAVKDIALAHETMPHKSTYFYPKLATGMVIKPL